jgi:hypothetical protein
MRACRLLRILAFGLGLALSIAAAAQPVARPEPAAVDMELRISLDPAARLLRGEGVLRVPPGPAETIILDKRYADATVQWRDAPLRAASAAAGLRAWTLPASDGPRELAVSWAGRLEPLNRSLDHRDTLVHNLPVTGEEGSFLPADSVWHPLIPERPMRYHLELRLPAGQRGLVPGNLLDERDDATGYVARFSFPRDGVGIDLMAGPYQVTERMVTGLSGRALRLRTWFLPGLEDLADAYLDSVADHLRTYEDWIGPYPLDGFSVVASPTPTGFGMASLTYLGADVIRLPFIRTTSLGHEVLHNWWGNGVRPAPGRGNWTEGLTTLMADYHARERESAEAARDTRLGWLRDVTALPPERDAGLEQFTARTHGASHILGYQKTAMLLLMLRDHIGRATFDRGLRTLWQTHAFRPASWDELRRAWEGAAGQDLGAFLEPWLLRPGIPAVRVESARLVRAKGGEPLLRVHLSQDTPDRVLRVPLVLRGAGRSWTAEVLLEGAARTVDLAVPVTPEEVVLDPDARLLRRLGAGEAPPILRDLMVDLRTTLRVLSADAGYRSTARELADRLLDATPEDRQAMAPLDGPSLVVGSRTALQAFLAQAGLGEQPQPDGEGAAGMAWTLRGPAGAVLAIAADSEADLRVLARALPHLGRQSWLVIREGRVSARGIWPSRPQVAPVQAVQSE